MSPPNANPGPARWVYFGLGWAFFGLGALGALLPVLPTTPLMILALWAFSKSSARFQHWLYRHRVFGPPLQRWHEYRVIPTSAKLAAVGAMAASLGYLAAQPAARRRARPSLSGRPEKRKMGTVHIFRGTQL